MIADIETEAAAIQTTMEQLNNIMPILTKERELRRNKRKKKQDKILERIYCCNFLGLD